MLRVRLLHCSSKMWKLVEPSSVRVRVRSNIPSVFDEGIVVSCVCLAAVHHHPHQLVVLRDGDLLPGRASRGAVAAALAALGAAVLASHAGDGVRLHVQHPGELRPRHKG